MPASRHSAPGYGLMESAAAAPARPGQPAAAARSWPRWWPLAALTLLAAALRLPTLGAQSLWYDEAFTPVHVLHASLGATLHAVAHTENSPPLWYLLEWALTRVFGTGEVALRALSALAGVATVPVAWAVGRELAGRRAAVATALLVAVNPLFVWYSQEARVYALFVLTAALALLCFLRALRDPTPGRLAAFAAAGALALATHYFAVFLLTPMCLWLLASSLSPLRPTRVSPARDPDAESAGRSLSSNPARVALLTVAAVAAVALAGLALVPLIVAQGGHGTQWIGRWALSSRLQAIPQYYLTDYYGSALGHGVELLVALPILAGILYGLWRGLTPQEERGALLALVITACGVLVPILLVALGADYLAPRNLVAAMIPLTALLAVIVVARRTGRVGPALAGVIALGFLAITVDVDLSPRLQRGDWRGLAAAIRAAPIRPAPRSAQTRVITTVELGAAPLEYYLPPLHNLAPGASVTVSEIDETGYAPLREGAREPPAPGFRLVQLRDIHGLILYRFRSPVPRAVPEATLRRHVITLEHPEVLVR
ncbi:MAG: glycosyltransferase family 39 protein [Solirubrobacterales bacterium]